MVVQGKSKRPLKEVAGRLQDTSFYFRSLPKPIYQTSDKLG